MLPTLIDLALAFLISRLFLRWWAWLGMAALSGTTVALTYHLGLAVLDYVPPGVAVLRALHGIVTHAVFTALCTWAFVEWWPSGPARGADPPQ